MPNTDDPDCKLDDRMSNSWAEEVETEDQSCIAVSNTSTSSSGQVILSVLVFCVSVWNIPQGLSVYMSSTEATTHREVLGSDDKVTILVNI